MCLASSPLRPGDASPDLRVDGVNGKGERSDVFLSLKFDPLEQARTKTELPQEQELGGLQGKGIRLIKEETFPELSEFRKLVPKHCFERSTGRSLLYATMSVGLVLGLGLAAHQCIPLKGVWTPVWLCYAAVSGTCMAGWLVLAHECGHRAFSESVLVCDTVGYLLNSAMLWPYFSWQRSHQFHHSRCNHVMEGELHVPPLEGTPSGNNFVKLSKSLGEVGLLLFQLGMMFTVGTYVYLLTGHGGGHVRGATSHYFPYLGQKGKYELFPGSWKAKVWFSDIGVAAMLAILYMWTKSAGSIWPVVALYVGPLVVGNAWLVVITWLHHTDVDLPHLDNDEWTWVKGSFMTVDRPYGPVLNFLHHSVGGYHIVHHLFPTMPHYHTKEATLAIRKAYPELCLYDHTPIWKALLRVASKCVVVTKHENLWVYRNPNHLSKLNYQAAKEH